jgi:AhpD family alkylhydroperoxidase
VTQRLSVATVAPEAVKVLLGFGSYLRSRELDTRLRALVDIRVSQLNGCAFCLDMHCQEAREAGETQQRLDCLAAWRETDLFSPREKAALAWAESVTLLSHTHVPDDVYAEVREHFSEAELVDLTMVVIAINSWNRLSVSFRREPPGR